MNWLDYILAITLISSVIAGLMKGLARTVVGIITVVAALVVASWTYGVAGGFVREYVSWPGLANFIGFAVVFSVILLAGEIIGRLLAKMLKWMGLGWLDRILGAGAGLVRGLLIAIVFVMLLCAFTRKPPPASVVESRIAPYIIDAASVISGITPKELREGFEQSYDRAKEEWKKLLDK